MIKRHLLFYFSPDGPATGSGPAPLIGEVPKTQTDAWKAANDNGIFAVKKAGRIAYFKQPGFKELDAYYALGKAPGSKISEEWQALTGMLFLDGCRELIESPKYLPNVAKRIQDAIAGEESELVNF